MSPSLEAFLVFMGWSLVVGVTSAAAAVLFHYTMDPWHGLVSVALYQVCLINAKARRLERSA